MAMFYRHLNLLPENQEIYLRNQKRRLIFGVIAATIFAGTYYYYYTNNINNFMDTKAVVFPIFAAGLMTADRLYVVAKRQTYWQLHRQDLAKGREEATEMLNSMKGVGNGKK